MTDQTKRKPPEQLPPTKKLTGRDYERQQRNLQILRELMGLNPRAVT